MSHMPLARRYRPQQFAQVLGQSSAVAALQNALARNKTAQAYLFCGTRGSGKTTLARLLAKAVNCEQPSSDGEPCSQCSSCRAMLGGNHLDVIEIDGASHRGIDDVRQIKETVSFQPTLGRFKVYIIDEVHMLTKEAFNALLKTLEEPPPGVKFIFATTEPHKIPLTILSRCQRFQLRRITSSTIRDHLKSILESDKISYDQAALVEISERAEGSLRDSLSLLDQLLAFQPGHLSYSNVQELLGLTSDAFMQQYEEAIQVGSNTQALLLVQQLLEMGIEGSYFLEQLQEHYRRLLQIICRLNDEELTGERRAFYEGLIPLYRESDLIFILNFLQQSLQQAKMSLQPRLHLEVTLLHLVQKPWLYSIDHLMDRLAQLEQRLTMANAPAFRDSQATPLQAAPIGATLTATAMATTPPESTPLESRPHQQGVSSEGVGSPMDGANAAEVNPEATATKAPIPETAINKTPVPAALPIPAAPPVPTAPISQSSVSTTLNQPPFPVTAAKPRTTTPLALDTKATPVQPSATLPSSSPSLPIQEQLTAGRYEGLIHFAAKELGGHLR